MPKVVLLEEFHVTMSAPAGLPDVRYVAMRRTLTGKGFRGRLRRAVTEVLRKYPSLARVRATVSW